VEKTEEGCGKKDEGFSTGKADGARACQSVLVWILNSPLTVLNLTSANTARQTIQRFLDLLVAHELSSICFLETFLDFLKLPPFDIV
jgi:hypothetical protein